MSLVLSSTNDKNQIVDMLFTIVQKLTFHGIAHNDKVLIAEHFIHLCSRKEDMDVVCRLAIDPITEKTQVVITLAFQPQIQSLPQ